MPKIKKITAYKVSGLPFYNVNGDIYCYDDLFIHFAPDKQYQTAMKQINSTAYCNYIINWIESHFNFIGENND